MKHYCSRTHSTLPSISTLLRACKSTPQLHRIHAQIICKGLHQDQHLITHLICLCTSLRRLPYATRVFNAVHTPTICLWNSLVKAHCELSSVSEAFRLFLRMQCSETRPDSFTFPSLIKVCANQHAVRGGAAVHGVTVRCGLCDDLYVMTSLVDMYGKFREIECARKVFDEMPDRTVVSWTAMVVGYVNAGDMNKAKKLFDVMPQRNVVTWNAMIDGFVKLGELVTARKMFDNMPEKNVVSFTVMIDGYAKAGDMESARNLFNQSPKLDNVAFSALISGYASNGQPNEAVKIFFQMDTKHLRPDEFIVVSLMSACSQIGDLELAKWVDGYVGRCHIDHQRPHVMAALVDMNAKCGNLERADLLFQQMPNRDVITYCSMIKGLSMHGLGVKAVDLFGRMLREGLVPDIVAFTVILSACSHAGLVAEGCYYFDVMVNTYSIVPTPDHYACMADLLARSGRLKDAYDLIKSMPIEPHASAWGAILGACKLHCDTELGEEVGSRLFTLERNNAANYVLLSHIYAAAGRWGDVSLLRDKMNEMGITKVIGHSRV